MAMKITEALLAEHAVFHSLFDHLETALPRLRTLAEVKRLAELLEAMLEAHSKVEDALIVEPLEHCIEQLGQREGMRQEHEEIDASLRRASASRELKEARKLLLAAVVFSRQHFDREERVIFPMAEKLLKGKTLAALGDSWAQQRKAILT
jgi:hemerythrin-like domain-containing protein